MTRPTPPGVVVELDVMDVMEWEHDQPTSRTPHANLATLVEQTVKAEPVAERRRMAVTRPPDVPMPTRLLHPVPRATPSPGQQSAAAASVVPRPAPRGSSVAPVAPPEPRAIAMSSGLIAAIDDAASAVPTAREAGATPTAPIPGVRGAGGHAPSDGPGPRAPAAAEARPRSSSRLPIPPQSIDSRAPVEGRAHRPSRPAPGTAESTSAVPLPLPAPADTAQFRALEERPQAPERSSQAERHALSDESAAPAARWRWQWLWLGAASIGVGVGVALAVASGGSSLEGTIAPAKVAVAHDDTASPPGSTAPIAPGEPAAPPGSTASELDTISGVAAMAPATEPAAAATDAQAGPVHAERSRPIAGLAPAALTTRSGPTVRPARRVRSQQVVVEYATPGEVAMPGLVAHSDEDPAVERARRAYLSGNQKLFAGQIDGAIDAYRRALELYPGYVGGYRGLGLAYAQRGDTRKALDAFRTYVATVPTAKDVALIKKRIARLQGK